MCGNTALWRWRPVGCSPSSSGTWVDKGELWQLNVDSAFRIGAIRYTSIVANDQVPRQIALWQIDAKLHLRARWQPRVACVKQGK